MLIGLPFGTHRVIASKVSWRIFPMMNIYGIALLCVGEIYFKDNEGDPDVDPTKFGRGTTIAVDGLAGVMFLIPLLLWLRTQSGRSSTHHSHHSHHSYHSPLPPFLLSYRRPPLSNTRSAALQGGGRLMVACAARLAVTDWPLWRFPLQIVWSSV